MIRFISFNINGIRARQHQLEEIKKTLNPNVMGLQETKVHDEQFPLEDIESLGWFIEYFGQKAHYGVALVSRHKPLFTQKGFPGDSVDDQKRFIHCRYEINNKMVDVLNGYFPQGESNKHETKYPAKRKFYADLMSYLENNLKDAKHIVLMGDMNISPEDQDIGIGEKNRERWLKSGKCSFLPEEREWYNKLLGLGLVDVYRQLYPDNSELFSWFDYRSKGFDDSPKRGLRIDHILSNKTFAEKCVASSISYDIRAMEKPSDHAPIFADYEF